jgi:hypothetical protein
MNFRRGFLQATSARTTDLASRLKGSFDVALFAGSWDRRCLSITSASGLSVRRVVFLNFAVDDAKGIQQNNERELHRFFVQRGAVVSRVDGVSENVELEWTRVWAAVMNQYAGPAFRVLVDLTTCPRYYALGVVAGLLSTGVASEVVTLYAEGAYDPGHIAVESGDVAFSIGRWDNLPVPFLHGRLEPTLKRYYLVSVGFEGTKTARVLARDDPDRVSLLYPIPGVKPEYDMRVVERNASTVERFRVPESQILRVAAGDSVGVWRSLSNAALEQFATEDVYYLCCGTKAHSLGMVLRALETGRATVLYNVPERHNFVDVSPTGVYWLTHVRDLSSPVPIL